MVKGSFCSVQEAADILGCSDGYIRRLLIDGKIKGEKLSERVWLVNVASVEAYDRLKITVGRPRKNSA